MTKTLNCDEARTGWTPGLAPIFLPRENAGRDLLSLEQPWWFAGEGEAEQEESLVTDRRSALTPSQMVDEKLAALLGAAGGGAAGAAGDQYARRILGSREGAGPLQRAGAAQGDAVLEPG